MGYLKFMYHRLSAFYGNNVSYNRVSKAFVFIWSINIFFLLELFTITNKYPNIFSFIITFSTASMIFYFLQIRKKYLNLIENAEKHDNSTNRVIFIIHIILTILSYAFYMFVKYSVHQNILN